MTVKAYKVGLILTLCVACLFLRNAHAAQAETRVFTVERGASARELARALKAQGFILSDWSFLVWVKLHSGAPGIRPGVYALAPGDTGRTIYKKFLHGPPLYRLTFPEGWTSRQMAGLLESKGITPGADFLNLVDQEKREGYLFPDTYFFQQGMNAQNVIDRMVQRFHEMEPKDFVAQAKALHLSYGQITTLASLVEKEARVPAERPIIAGVFLNRLKKRWRLESCATVQYALGSWKPQLTYKDLEIQSPYNTYRHSGLPPGPICNPGAPSLVAAAHPAPTEMMFFVAEGGGTHRFSRYYNEHLQVQKEMKKKK